MYTSQKLSKLLAENGCELEGSSTYEKLEGTNTWIGCVGKCKEPWKYKIIQRYDILNDICVRYAKEFFGENEIINKTYLKKPSQEHGVKIYKYVKNGFIQEAEDYIWEHCKFNPNNK